jgi:hypothetical protein
MDGWMGEVDRMHVVAHLVGFYEVGRGWEWRHAVYVGWNR